MRFFLGVGKYTPIAALYGEMGWDPPIVRQWISISRYYVRLSCTNHTRLNKRIAIWASETASSKCKNWYYLIHKHVADLNLNLNLSLNVPLSVKVINSIHDATMSSFVSNWLLSINCPTGPSKRGMNKLRTYCTFKNEYCSENCCKIILPLRHRAAFAKFRCGVAPLRIETGRYEGLTLENRTCPFCNAIESEEHVLLECKMYNDIRTELFQRAVDTTPTFTNFTSQEKLIFLFSDIGMIRSSAKTCFNILQKRNFYLCK
jgi:hypothetical protein